MPNDLRDSGLVANDLRRLASAAAERRHELHMTQKDVAARGGPSDTTIGKIEAGQLLSPAERTLRRLDIGLSWRSGSAERILRGGEPIPDVDAQGDLRPPPGSNRRPGLEDIYARVDECRKIYEGATQEALLAVLRERQAIEALALAERDLRAREVMYDAQKAGMQPDEYEAEVRSIMSQSPAQIVEGNHRYEDIFDVSLGVDLRR